MYFSFTYCNQRTSWEQAQCWLPERAGQAYPVAMQSKTPLYAVLLASSVAAFPAAGQGTSSPDPEFLRQYAATNRFTLGLPAAIQITRQGNAVLFLRSPPRSFVRDLYEFDVATGREKKLASAEQILGGQEEKL